MSSDPLRLPPQWRELLDAVGHPALIIDRDHTILAANGTCLRLFGVGSEEELKGRSCYSLAHNTSEPVDDCPLRVLARDPSRGLAAAAVPALGKEFLVSCTQVELEGGERAFLHVMVEVTAAAELQRIRDGLPSLYRDLVDNANDLIQIVDPQGRFLYVNRAWLRTLGYSREEVAHLTLFDVIHPDCRLSCGEQFRRVLEGEPLYHVEVQFRTKEGGKVICEGSCNCRFEKGVPVSTRGIFRDITRRKVAEQALAELMRRHELILNSVGEGIVVVDPAGRLSYANPVALSILRYEQKEIMGRDLHTLIHHTDQEGRPHPPSACPINLTLTEVVTISNRRDLFWRKDGRGVPVEFTSTPIVDEGRVTGAVVAFRDVSEKVKAEEERKRMEAQLLQAQKMEAIGTLAAGVAHDFNNILTAIQGYTEVAAMKLKDDHPVRQDLEHVLEASGRAANLVRQLLLFSRKQPMEMELVDLNRLVEGLLKMLKRIIGEDVEVVTRLESGLWPLRADPGQLEQIIMNLAVNARDAMPDGGTLTLETASVELTPETARLVPHGRPGRFVRLTVADTGHGMDQETLSHIFEPFFTTKGPARGTGLGLSVVYGIVNQHGGWINCFSTPGRGTTFRIYLPAEEGGEAGESHFPDTAAAPKGRGELILLVEDEPLVLGMAQEGLTAFGYQVVTATNLQDAREIMARGEPRPRLVFTDVVLPDGDGIEVANEARRRWPGVAVLLASGYTDEKTGVAIAREFRFPFLRKPYTVEEMLKKVREALDGGDGGGEPGPGGP